MKLEEPIFKKCDTEFNKRTKKCTDTYYHETFGDWKQFDLNLFIRELENMNPLLSNGYISFQFGDDNLEIRVKVERPETPEEMRNRTKKSQNSTDKMIAKLEKLGYKVEKS